MKEGDIKNFYLSQRENVVRYYQYFCENLFQDKSVNLEKLYWFLLLKKYLKVSEGINNEEIYDYIKRCELLQENRLGFKFSPDSQQTTPDVWSTYFALACLKLIGELKQYLLYGEQITKTLLIKTFLLSLKKGNRFLHCLDDDCEICKKTSTARTLYFALELFLLIDIDVRAERDMYFGQIDDRKKDPSQVFKLICLQFLGMESEVREKELQYLHELQGENGGYNFEKGNGRPNPTFWTGYVIHNYSWLLDYNPSRIYSFINLSINGIINSKTKPSLPKLMELSKMVILLSLVWSKFIEEIERILFKQLEQDKYVSLELIEKSFGLTHGIEEVLSYINQYFTFTLRILDKKSEFRNFMSNYSHAKRIIITDIYAQFEENSIVSLSNTFKKYKHSSGFEDLKLKEDIIPLLIKLRDKNFFKGKILGKRTFRTKYYFYLDFLIKKAIVSDTDINTENLFYEKEKLKDIKNDIFNMTLTLKNASTKIKDEIESYLMLDEVDYAKQRLKFIFRTALMDADFLNENIENSFNEDLYYIDIQSVLASDIYNWDKAYSILRNRLNQTNSYLKGKINEKEQMQNVSKILDKLEERVLEVNDSFNKRLNGFRSFLRDSLERGYSNETFHLIIEEFEKLKNSVSNFDKKVYLLSQKINPEEKKLKKKHKSVINTWVGIKDELNDVFDYYLNGFSFFNENLKKIDELKVTVNKSFDALTEKTKDLIKGNKFEEAFSIINKGSDVIIKANSEKIKEIKPILKKEIKSKQKLYLLYRYLPEKLDELEESTISIITEKVQALKNRVIEERNLANIEDFDSFVLKASQDIKQDLINYDNSLHQTKERKVKEIIGGFEEIESKFNDYDTQFSKKLKSGKGLLNDFEEQSKFTILQWNQFRDSFIKEISALKDEHIQETINHEISRLSEDKSTNNIKISDLKKELGIKCTIIISRIKEMIEISILNGELNEEEKRLLVYTTDYYKNKELRSYLENQLLKETQEKIGKVLALYDSSIRNQTLNVNMLELQNRIKDLKNFDKTINFHFSNKLKELQIQIGEREEYLETKEFLDSVLDSDHQAIRNINGNLSLYSTLQGHIIQNNNDLRFDFGKIIKKVQERFENKEKHSKIKQLFEHQLEKFKEHFNQRMGKIETMLQGSLKEKEDSMQLSPELRKFFVSSKNEILKEFEEKKEKIQWDILTLKDETFRNDLIMNINNHKIHLSQLLGTLQARVEDDIDAKEYKRAYFRVEKRVKDIQFEIKDTNKKVKLMVKDFNKQYKNFGNKNKHIMDDFDNFLTEYDSILSEKIKSLEQFIIKSYIEVAIKAVSNEFLTVSFLNNELKIKKQSLKEHIIHLISEDKLNGKYDPIMGIYYENLEVLKDLDEAELEVIKKMNFRLYMFIRRFKSFTSRYGSIIAFFAAISSFTYTIFQFSGGNPAIISVPVIAILVLVVYMYFSKGKEEKVKV